jgi:hypothetical protein
MRYFRAEIEAYENARRLLNASWGIPTAGTETALPAPGQCLQDNSGNVFFGVDGWMCEMQPASDLLQQAISQGTATEITEAELLAADAQYGYRD